MSKINWRSALEGRGIDPDEFKTEFEENLQSENIIEKLLQLAAFQAVYHDCRECEREGDCSECYSGDTEFEMTHDTLNLRDIWNETFETMAEEIYNSSDDSNGYESESPDTESPQNNPNVKVKKI